MADRAFWRSILRSAESDPRDETCIRGASGIEYSAVALGLDESRRRLLVVSAEHDARTAAMAQVDIQSAVATYQVLVARPVVFDLPACARIIRSLTGRTVFSDEDLRKLDTKSDDFKTLAKDKFEKVFGHLDFLSQIPLNITAQLLDVIQQIALLRFDVRDSPASPGEKHISMDLDPVVKLDALERDNHFGLCPVPLYEFTGEETETLNSGSNLDAVREILKGHGVLQYFFPAPDLLALGLIDRGSRGMADVLDQVLLAPRIGHPYGETEIVGSNIPAHEVIDALQERGLVVEGEYGYEVGPTGQTIRQTMRFKPREGFISKVLNRISLKVDLKSLISAK